MAELAEFKTANVIVRGTELFISISTDFHKAFLMIKPPEDKTKICDVRLHEILALLAANNVKFEVDEKSISDMLEKKKYFRQVCVSTWREPIEGKDGSIEYLFPQTIELVPKKDELGRVDYRDLGYVRYIERGTVIANITPPEEGACGYDVRGLPIRQYVGKPAPFHEGENVRLSADGLTLIAIESGHLEYKTGAFNVFTTLTVQQDVDASTGNISFDGNIVVKGNIADGYKVSSTRDITVAGRINGASIEAGGDVEIKNGIFNSKITSHGTVKSKFCEFSTITTDGDVIAQDFLVSKVYAGCSITASKSLSGGKYTCINGGSAGTIGTKAYARTEISVGDNSVLAEEKKETKKKIEEVEKQIDQCTQIINFITVKKKEGVKLSTDKDALFGRTIRTKYSLMNEKKQLEERIAEIDERLETKQLITFDCKGEVFPGSIINISGYYYYVRDEMKRISFRLTDNDDIEAVPL